jgi:hypothetical protein
MKKIFFCIASVFFFASFNLYAKKPIARPPFPVEEYAALPVKNSGTATITGQAFLRTVGGDVKTAAGQVVMLNPETSYSDFWYQKSYLSNQKMEESDPRLLPYIYQTIADADGRFKFGNVPAGKYFLTTQVVWRVPMAYGVLVPTGGWISRLVSVEDGKEIEVILTR